MGSGKTGPKPPKPGLRKLGFEDLGKWGVEGYGRWIGFRVSRFRIEGLGEM